MTGRFDRLSLKNFAHEDKAVGAAVGAVLAGAVGLALFNPLGGGAAADTAAQAAAQNGRTVRWRPARRTRHRREVH